MRRPVLVSVLAVGASLAAWCGTASAGGGYGGPPAPQTHDRYNNDHRDSDYAPGPRVYGYTYCCGYSDYSDYYVRRPSYYHHSYYYRRNYYHSDYYRSPCRSDYGYRRWHRGHCDD